MNRNTSHNMRANPLFMRNQFEQCGQWGLPKVKKQVPDLTDVRLIAYSDTRPDDSERNRQCGVHFFIDDYRMEGNYRNPQKSLQNYRNMLFC